MAIKLENFQPEVAKRLLEVQSRNKVKRGGHFSLVLTITQIIREHADYENGITPVHKLESKVP